MFFEDLEVIYGSNIFEYSQLFESLQLEHKKHDTSDMFVFEY